LIRHDVFPVAREETELRAQVRSILLCEPGFKNRIDKSGRHVLLQATYLHVISVDKEFQQRIDSIVLLRHPFCAAGQKFTPRRGNRPSRFAQLKSVYSHRANSPEMFSIRRESGRITGAKTDSDLVAVRTIFTFSVLALPGQ
jgi:hypothetical protein